MKKLIIVSVIFLGLLTACNNKENSISSQVFKTWGTTVSKDESNVYVEGRVVEGADAETFESLIFENYAFKDKNNVYMVQGGNDEDFYLRRLENVDANSFELIDDYGDYEKYPWGQYARDKNHVFYSAGSFYDNALFVPIENADPNTFDYLSGEYAKDKNHVYRGMWIIEGVDVDTFEALGSDAYRYVKDKNYVYFSIEPLLHIENADPKTFFMYKEFLGDYTISKDKNNVYLNYEVLEGADAETFGQLNGDSDPYLFKDKNNVYQICNAKGEAWWLEIYENVDVDSFEEVEGYGRYGKDKNYVYYATNPTRHIEGADPSTFQCADRYYCRDKNNVYFAHEVVEGVDPETFEYLEGGYSRDKNNTWYFWYSDTDPKTSVTKIIKNGDPSTFKVLDYYKGGNYFYAKDKNNFYYKGVVIPENDLKIKELEKTGVLKP